MRLTVYTDYTLRVLMYLSMKHGDGSVATIDEIAGAYGVSRNHVNKIVNELAQNGVIETVRGRAGGARLARDPAEIAIGDVVRLAEKDFAVAQCHDDSAAHECAIMPACHLQRVLRRALDAFMEELDRTTLADAVTAPSVAAPLLGLPGRPSIRLHPTRPALPVRNRRAPTAGRARPS